MAKRCQHHKRADRQRQCELRIGHPGSHDYDDPKNPFHDSNRQETDDEA